MSKLMVAPAAAAALVWVLAGSATGASGHGHCAPCGPLPPTIHVHIVHPSSTYTRYHDESVYRHVPRVHQIVTVTKVQPIVHVNEVTRIHHRTVYYVKDAYAHETIHVPPLTYVHPSVVNIYDGGCGCGGY